MGIGISKIRKREIKFDGIRRSLEKEAVRKMIIGTVKTLI